MKKTLEQQWVYFLELPSATSRFTKDLYEAMYTRSGFIAHFDRQGFFRARFWTLNDFDQTIEMMRQAPELRALLLATSSALMGNARYKIAAMEAATLQRQSEVIQNHIIQLQARFSVPLIGGAK